MRSGSHFEKNLFMAFVSRIKLKSALILTFALKRFITAIFIYTHAVRKFQFCTNFKIGKE